MNVSGRRIAVVGATGAIGSAIVADLLEHGANVLATGRSPEGLAAIRSAGAAAMRLDLAPPHQAGEELHLACTEAFGPALDGLVLTAGAHGPIGPTRALDPIALSKYLNEQLVSLVALIGALAPHLDAGDSPSVVALSGGGATGPRPRYSAYAMGKVALVRLVENLAIEEPTWRVNAVAPGFIASAIHDTSIAAGQGRSGEDPEEITARLAKADDPARAAGLVRMLLSGDGAVISGRLISAVWDPWGDASWRSTMAADDSLGRLRRIDGEHFVEDRREI